MPGVALCESPESPCAGCHEWFPHEQLAELHRFSSELYCPGCVFSAQQRADKGRDEDCYGA